MAFLRTAQSMFQEYIDQFFTLNLKLVLKSINLSSFWRISSTQLQIIHIKSKRTSLKKSFSRIRKMFIPSIIMTKMD